jgi:transposase-like protein
MKEIRRRTRVVGAFPDGQSCLNLAAARLRYIAGTAWSAKWPKTGCTDRQLHQATSLHQMRQRQRHGRNSAGGPRILDSLKKPRADWHD